MKKPFGGNRGKTGRPAAVRDSRGMALVLTLLIVAIITAMVVEFAYGVYTTTASLSNWETSQQLSLAARSAIKLAARLVAVNAQKNDTNGTFSISQKIPFGSLDTTVTLTVEDPNAKFNLNSIVLPNGHLDRGNYATYHRYKQFRNLLTNLALPTSIADRVADWIDPDSNPMQPGSEAGAKNGYLDSVDELLLIPGIDRKTYERLLPYVTIYGNGCTEGNYCSGKINVNNASLTVIESVLDVDKSTAEQLIEYRKKTPLTIQTNIYNIQPFSVSSFENDVIYTSSMYHVTATAESGGIKRTIDSVLQASGLSAQVIYWKEM